MTEHPPAGELTGFVSQLLQTTGSLMLIVDHLSRTELAGLAPPGAEPIPAVLGRLLASVLTPLAEWYGTATLDECAAVLADAADLAQREVFAVAAPPPAGRVPTGGRRGRRTP